MKIIYAVDKIADRCRNIEQMEIKRDYLLDRLINLRHNKMIKVY